MRLRLLLATVTGLVLAMTGVASAQEEGDATVTVVHDIDSLDPVDISVDGDVVVEALAYGDSAGPLTLAAGTYSVEVLDAESDENLLGPADYSLEAGIAYTITATLVDGAPGLTVDEEPLADDEDDETGTLLFEHDITGGPTVGVVVLPFGEEDDAVDLGTVDAGESFDAALPVGEHVLTITDEAGEDDLGSTEFEIEADTTTTVRASAVLDDDDDEDEDEDIETPNRVDTGAGGTSGGGSGTIVLLLTALTAAGAGAATVARRRAA